MEYRKIENEAEKDVSSKKKKQREKMKVVYTTKANLDTDAHRQTCR